MHQFKRLICTLGLLSICSIATATETTYQYCSELYPADSYEAEERQLYVQECIEANATEEEQASPMFSGSGTQEQVEQPSDEYQDMDTYEGTVEDFIDDSSE